MRYDAVYWWQGGSEQGRWIEAQPGANVHETVRALRRMGYVAHPGRRSIGAPEGAPSREELTEVLSS